MTTKNLKMFEELNREYFKLREEKRLQAIEDKKKRAAEEQALMDSGLARAIITKPREALPEPEPIPEEKLEEQLGEVPKELPKDENGKVECPECGGLFTKGAPFNNHFKTHLNGD